MDASDRQKRSAAEAAEWWVTLQGEVSRTQREQYVDWLRESPLHVAEMLHVAQVHGALEQFQGWSGIQTHGLDPEGDNIVTLATALPHPEARVNTSARRPRRPFVWAAAAALLLIACSGTIFLRSARSGFIQTERGERREVALDDGSVVQVDPETLLRIKYEKHLRRVFLEHGRALFRVAKNPERPFLVESNDTTVRAVGTAFAVEQQDNAVLVTVAEGKVAVFPTQLFSSSSGFPPVPSDTGTRDAAETPPRGPLASLHNGSRRVGGDSRSLPLPTGSAAAIYLVANQQVSVARFGNAEAVHAVDSDRALAWADGRLIFENSTVADAVQQFNRYNRIQIIVHDVALTRRSVSGVFSAADPESFAAFLQSVARVRITHGDNADIAIDSAL
jgi:transmembrane sensor